jgi:zeaxanthin glucosyltransferase
MRRPQRLCLAVSRPHYHHTGLIKALQSLSCAVPMLAFPITNDQPGVAARVAWSGSGSLEPLKRTIDRVWSDSSYRQNAQRL